MTNSVKPESKKVLKFFIVSSIIFLSMVAALFTGALISDFVTGNYVLQEDPASGKTTLSVLVGLGICTGIIPVVFIIVLVRQLLKIKRLEKQQDDRWFQDRILELAKKLGGKLTVLETTTELNLSVDEANLALNQFVSLGLARLQVSESGVLVYYFDQMIGLDEKNRAENIV